jgi:hypothetical protein
VAEVSGRREVDVDLLIIVGGMVATTIILLVVAGSWRG